MESQSQSGRALAYKLGGFESTASLRIAYSLPNTKAATYLAVLQLGFTTVSIDRRDLPAVRQCPTLEDLKTLHAGFCRAILRSDSVLIPVKSAGKGPTPASQKVKVSLSWADPQDSEKIQSESTITVPVSQLQMVEGQLFVPRWLVRKTLNNRSPGLPKGCAGWCAKILQSPCPQWGPNSFAKPSPVSASRLWICSMGR